MRNYIYMFSLDNYVVSPVTGTLSFLTLYSPSTVSSGDDDYSGPVSTGTSAFAFGNSYIYNVYVSTIHCKNLKVVLTCVLGPLNFFLMSERQQIRSGMTFDFG